MAYPAAATFAAVLMLAMAVDLPNGEAVLSCSDVENDLMPCLNYVIFGGEVSLPCCKGIQTIVDQTKLSVGDRRAVCNCLKELAQSASEDDLSRAAGIPSKCGISIPFKISQSIDCSRVK